MRVTDWVLFLIAVVLGLSWANVMANFAFAWWAKRKRCETDHRFEWPFVSVLVPARNEAHNIETCVSSLLKQDYPNYEVIALNDDSTDDTGAILDRLDAQHARLRVIHNHQPLPSGWNGKSRACQMLADNAHGEWLLFVDADTTHAAHSIRSGVEQAIGLGAALFSAIPKQIIGSWGERLFVPAGFALVYSLTVMWRLYLLRTLRLSNAAAIGQYLLAQRDAYFACGGHDAIRDKILDDVFLAILFKRNGYRIALTDADFVACRMYRGFADMAMGFSKNAFATMKGSLVLSIFFVAANTLLFFLPLVMAVFGLVQGVVLLPAWTSIALTTIIFVLVNLRIGQPVWTSLLYPIQLLVGMGILLNSILWHRSGRTQWKGRTLNER